MRWFFSFTAFMLFMFFMVQPGPAAAQCGPNGCPTASNRGRAILPGIAAQPALGQQPAEAQPEAVARIANTVSLGKGGRGAISSYGTGTLIARDQGRGYVITCWHLFRDGRGEVIVRFSKGAYTARVLAADEGADLALLEIADPGIAQVAVAAEFPRPGEPLRAGGVGPDGRWRSVRGTLAGYRTTAGGTAHETLEMSGGARDGDSGGPVFNGRGELAGVIWGTDSRTIEATYCGRVKTFFVETLRRARQAPPPGPARRLLPGLCKPREPAPLDQGPAAPTPAAPDPRVSDGVDVLRSLDARAADLQGRAQSLDQNVQKIEGYLRPEESTVNPGLMILAIAVALVVGAVLFYATQRHSPLG
jgi:hypothetical protein